MGNEEKIEQPVTPPVVPELQRGVVTDVIDAAVALGPTAGVVVDDFLNRPPKPEPPQVVIPPGVRKPER